MRTRAVAAGATATLIALPLQACARSCDPCGDKAIQTLPSPDGQHRAVLFRRDCGATTGFATHLALVRAGHDDPESANVLILDTDHGRAPWNEDGSVPVVLTWLDGMNLRVEYPQPARSFLKRERLDGVAIHYESAPAIEPR